MTVIRWFLDGFHHLHHSWYENQYTGERSALGQIPGKTGGGKGSYYAFGVPVRVKGKRSRFQHNSTIKALEMTEVNQTLRDL